MRPILQRDDIAVLTVGSLHYDIMVEADHLPRRDETAVGTRWFPKFGGKGGNQAVAVARAGIASRMVGAVGRDDFGTFLRDALRAAQVDDTHVATIDGSGSGMSVAIADASGDYAATIVSGANLLIDEGAMDAAPWADVRMLVLQNEVREETNLAAARAAHGRGVPVILNAAPARPLPVELSGLVDILVVNGVEAEMYGSDSVTDLDSAAAAASLLVAGYPIVIVTAGGAGLAFATRDGQRGTVPARKVSVISTHGAGDCFTGSLAAALAAGHDLATACTMASDASARHVSTAG